jgi:DELLA protein
LNLVPDSRLSAEEVMRVARADKIDNQQCDNASKFLILCGFLSFNRGNSVQQVHYFAKVLQERGIEQEIEVVIFGNGKQRSAIASPRDNSHSNPTLITTTL